MAVWSIVKNSDIEHKRIDSEFYQPGFLEARTMVGDKKLTAYGASVQHPAEVKRVYSDSGLQIVLAQNNRDNAYDWSELRYMPEKMMQALERNRLETSDVTVTRSGANYGQTSVITIEPETSHLYACADLLVIKPGKISGCLLSTYLNTTYGKRLMLRGVYGAGQPHVAPNYVKEIPFPEFLQRHSEEIQNLVVESRRNEAQSQSLYTQAQQLLEQELGLDKLTFEKPVGYEARFSEVMEGRRIDSQCYSPEHINYEKYLRANSEFELLRNVLSSTLKGKQMVALDDGNLKYASIKDIQGLELVSDSYCSPAPDTRIAGKDTLLLAITGATIGKVGIVNRYDSLAFSGDLLGLITKDTVSPHYLLAVLQSPIGQSQCFRWITGSTNGHLSPNDVGKIVIPRLKEKSEQKISDFIVGALSARKESEALLEKAKSRVESLIEEAAAK